MLFYICPLCIISNWLQTQIHIQCFTILFALINICIKTLQVHYISVWISRIGWRMISSSTFLTRPLCLIMSICCTFLTSFINAKLCRRTILSCSTLHYLMNWLDSFVITYRIHCAVALPGRYVGVCPWLLTLLLRNIVHCWLLNSASVWAA